MTQLLKPFRIILIVISIAAVCCGNNRTEPVMASERLPYIAYDFAKIAYNPNSFPSVWISPLSGDYAGANFKYSEGWLLYLLRDGRVDWLYRRISSEDAGRISQLIRSVSPNNERKTVKLGADSFIVRVLRNDIVEYEESNSPQLDSLCRIIVGLSPIHFFTGKYPYARRLSRIPKVDSTCVKIGADWDSLVFSKGYCAEEPIYGEPIRITKNGLLYRPFKRPVSLTPYQKSKLDSLVSNLSADISYYINSVREDCMAAKLVVDGHTVFDFNPIGYHYDFNDIYEFLLTLCYTEE